MSYREYEESRHQGEPVTLYKFIWGDAPEAFDAYTDAEKKVHLGGDVYKPYPISRGNITSSGTLDKSALEIRTGIDTPIGQRFLAYPPGRVVVCIIRQGHLDDPAEQFPVVWSGRVISSGRETNEAVLTGEPVQTSMRRPGLRRNWQYGCPHVLYGSQCRASLGDATTSTIVEAMNGTTITLPSGWGGEGQSGKYLGGMARWVTPEGNTEMRTIMRVASSLSYILSGVPVGLEAGMGVDMILGCNHKMDDCRDLHNNILNFGGCPWIPLRNPVGNVSQYY